MVKRPKLEQSELGNLYVIEPAVPEETEAEPPEEIAPEAPVEIPTEPIPAPAGIPAEPAPVKEEQEPAPAAPAVGRPDLR